MEINLWIFEGKEKTTMWNEDGRFLHIAAIIYLA